MFHRIAVRRQLATTLAVIGLALAIPPVGHADHDPRHDVPTPPPPAVPPGPPYPTADLIQTTYTRVEPADYFIPGNYGVFFLSPTGLNCGIWLKGSFGCTGFLPGLPPGTNRIGWFNGEQRVHYDWTAAIQFPNVQANRVLPPGSYVNWNETTCVTMRDSGTYCERGMFRFQIKAEGTLLN